MSEIQTLNYCAHAIEDLKDFHSKIKDHVPLTSKALFRVIELLREAQKFILPNCCDIFTPDEFQQPHLDLFHLPFKVCAFEAPWIMENDNSSALDDSMEFNLSPKRISLCVQLDADNPEPLFDVYNADYLARYPQGGAYVIPIFWSVNTGWEVVKGGMFLPYQNTLTAIKREDIQENQYSMRAMVDTNRVGKSISRLEAEPFVLLPEVFEMEVHNYGYTKVIEQIKLDSHDEIMCAIQACAVLNCENIETATIAPNEKINHKRKKSNKEPFFTYRVLQIHDNSSSTVKGGGSHRSPRSHLRRGHIRRLENKAVWVRSAMINANSKDGSVVKEYKLG